MTENDRAGLERIKNLLKEKLLRMRPIFRLRTLILSHSWSTALTRRAVSLRWRPPTNHFCANQLAFCSTKDCFRGRVNRRGDESDWLATFGLEFSGAAFASEFVDYGAFRGKMAEELRCLLEAVEYDA
jgi:hypothetical protein